MTVGPLWRYELYWLFYCVISFHYFIVIHVQHFVTPLSFSLWLILRCSVAGGLSRMEIDARFRYYFQHPWSRLFVAYLVTFCNFLIFAEDPISHSQTEAHMIVVGNCFSFLFNKYPGLGCNILKVICWTLAIITGMLAGKFIFHRRLFGKSCAQRCRGMCRVMTLVREGTFSWVVSAVAVHQRETSFTLKLYFFVNSNVIKRVVISPPSIFFFVSLLPLVELCLSSHFSSGQIVSVNLLCFYHTLVAVGFSY